MGNIEFMVPEDTWDNIMILTIKNQKYLYPVGELW